MLRAGHVIALSVLALLMIGVVMVASAGMRVAPLGVDGLSLGGVTVESILLSRNGAYAAAALVLLMVASILPVRRWAAMLSGGGPRPTADSRPSRLHAPVLLLWFAFVGVLAILLLTVYLPGIGRTVNGSARWTGLGPIGFQPSEVVKWALLGALAWCAFALGPRLRSLVFGLSPIALGAGLLVGLVALEDLGTGVLMAAVVGVMLLAAGARLWHLALFVPPAIAAVLLLIVTSSYRARRILAFLDPYAYPETHGYHMIQSMIAIANGGGTGRGLGNGLQKFGYLPEDRTDFLYAVICEEIGLLGALIVAGLYMALLLSALRIVTRQPPGILKLFGVGVIATVGLQALMNMIVVTGLGPTKGIALPLLSAGGTGWMLTAACLGLLMAMDRTSSQPDAAANALDDTPWNAADDESDEWSAPALPA